MMATCELREKTLLEAGKESVASRRAALGSALPVSSSRVNMEWMDGKNLPALEPLLCQPSTELHAVTSVYTPRIYVCLSQGT